jgi:uncharacterized protein (DUF924 family)
MNAGNDTVTAQLTDVVSFWRAAGPDKWFTKDAAFDAAIREKFLKTYEAAAVGDLSIWETTAEGALALLILLDQFPRNMFRGNARTYATDPVARAVADRAVARGFDEMVDADMRPFIYLPFCHSEAMADQERAVALARANCDAETVKWLEHHADIIRRFGRFPHRNTLLGRTTTPEEQAYLDADGFKG